jgi:hypothetical protein
MGYAPVELLIALEQPGQLQPFMAAATPQELADAALACQMLGYCKLLLLENSKLSNH